MIGDQKDSGSMNLVAATSSLSPVSFDAMWGSVSESVDVTDQRLIGNVSAPHDFENHNFVRCFFEGNIITGFHILHMDFKDTTFSAATFDSCNIESSAFVNCLFNDVTISKGIFLNCTFQDCRFYGCTFDGVDLGNAFVKGCRISICNFTSCTTENHVFEECLFSKVHFTACQLQIDTVFKNYGLSRSLMTDCGIRNRRLREGGAFMAQEEIDTYSAPKNDLIAQLRLEYFHDSNFLSGSELLDTCLTNSSWLVGLHNDFTIGDKLSQFVEFLINLWEEDEIPCHTLLLAHQMTSHLVEVLRAEEKELYRVLLTIMGTHMLLSRKVEHYLSVLDQMKARLNGAPLVLIVNGPATPSYYQRLLPELFCAGDTQILKVRPHNSPSELFVYGITALAWFIASLERFRLEAYAAKLVPVDVDNALSNIPTSKGITLKYDKGKMLELRARALIPFSSLIVDLNMAVSTRVFAKFTRLVVNMLLHDDEDDTEGKKD